MVDLPKKKVGIVACSGEEIAEGTVTRLAALKVLEQLRPGDTVTICLPLFLAGGEGDRTFARFYPTITVDGCELGCAARATEMYSSKPAASLNVREIIAENKIGRPEGKRLLNQAGLQAVEATANKMATLVDEILEKRWDRRKGEVIDPQPLSVINMDPTPETVEATCSCGSGIPIQKVIVDGHEETLAALTLIFQQFGEAGKTPNEDTILEMMDTVKIYNPIPAEAESAYREAILGEYTKYWNKEMGK